MLEAIAMWTWLFKVRPLFFRWFTKTVDQQCWSIVAKSFSLNSLSLSLLYRLSALSASDSFIAWLKESLVQQELFTPNLTNPQQQPLVRFIQYLFSIILRNNSLYESIVGPLSQPATIKFCAEKTLTFQLLKLMQEVNGEHSPGISLNANRLLEILHNFNFESRNEQQVCF